MIERDYIMRMITQLSQFLAKVLLHKHAYEFPQARKELQSAYRSLLGWDPAFAQQFSDAQLVRMFGADEDIKATKCYILGSLMKEDAELLRLEGNESGADAMSARSLYMLLLSYNTARNEAEEGHLDRIWHLLKELRGAELPPHIQGELFACFEHTGRFDKAEDTIFELIRLDPSWVSHGLKFCERLLNRSDDELRAGGLSRMEVLQAHDDLRQR